jgi:hypothetical protein
LSPRTRDDPRAPQAVAVSSGEAGALFNNVTTLIMTFSLRPRPDVPDVPHTATFDIAPVPTC